MHPEPPNPPEPRTPRTQNPARGPSRSLPPSCLAHRRQPAPNLPTPNSTDSLLSRVVLPGRLARTRTRICDSTRTHTYPAKQPTFLSTSPAPAPIARPSAPAPNQSNPNSPDRLLLGRGLLLARLLLAAVGSGGRLRGPLGAGRRRGRWRVLLGLLRLLTRRLALGLLLLHEEHMQRTCEEARSAASHDVKRKRVGSVQYRYLSFVQSTSNFAFELVP